ncbi:uncharacterized protein LOC136027445 [Artemia franciscana]
MKIQVYLSLCLTAVDVQKILCQDSRLNDQNAKFILEKRHIGSLAAKSGQRLRYYNSPSFKQAQIRGYGQVRKIYSGGRAQSSNHLESKLPVAAWSRHPPSTSPIDTYLLKAFRQRRGIRTIINPAAYNRRMKNARLSSDIRRGIVGTSGKRHIGSIAKSCNRCPLSQ